MTDAMQFTAAYITHALGRALILIGGLSIEQTTAIARIIGVDAPAVDPCSSACCTSGPLVTSLIDLQPAEQYLRSPLRAAAESLMADIRAKGAKQQDGSYVLPNLGRAPQPPVSKVATDPRAYADALTESLLEAFRAEPAPTMRVDGQADVMADHAIAFLNRAKAVAPTAADASQHQLVRDILVAATRTGRLPAGIRAFAGDIATVLVAHMERGA